VAGVLCVLMVASGAEWESAALGAISGRSDLVVLKRCVDVDDLLASAAAGQADVAVVSVDAPGLDLVAADHLRRHRVRPVVIVPASTGRGVDAAADAARLRCTQWGITRFVEADDLDALLVAISAVDDAMPDSDLDPGPSLEPISDGRVVAFWGPQGAPGRTTLAVACAAELAGRGRRTILVDADPYGGAIAQQLGVVDEVSGLLAAARLSGAGTLAQRYASAQRALGDHLRVVTGLPRADRWSEVKPGVIEHVLQIGRERGDVLVDAGFCLEEDPRIEVGVRPSRNSLTLGALAEADEVVAVGAADPVGLARLARGLVELREVVGPAPVWVVVNRFRGSLGWSERDLLGLVEGFARPAGVHFVPDDRQAADRAITSGHALGGGGDSAVGRAVTTLVDALFGPAQGPLGRSGRLKKRTANRGRRR
jgi:MinD-like ATPase involved in chromosome partitioning or flagellar assembly